MRNNGGWCSIVLKEDGRDGFKKYLDSKLVEPGESRIQGLDDNL